eukprot:gene5546-11169_t
MLCGADVTGWTPERISRQGLGRSYQKTNIFQAFTVWDNVRLAAQSRQSQQPWNPLGWLLDASKSIATNDRATRAIELSGLKDRHLAHLRPDPRDRHQQRHRRQKLEARDPDHRPQRDPGQRPGRV